MIQASGGRKASVSHSNCSTGNELDSERQAGRHSQPYADEGVLDMTPIDGDPQSEPEEGLSSRPDVDAEQIKAAILARRDDSRRLNEEWKEVDRQLDERWDE